MFYHDKLITRSTVIVNVKIKRIYELPKDDDGFRIFIDESWPEGLSKEEAKVDLWLKEIAPTKDIDEWPEDKPARFGEFKENIATNLGRKKL
jgi:uncharacterized protein YeaO (DUF488 family)